jgi:dUTP pyrophosphatase
MIIPTKKLIPEAKLPEQQHVQDAGFDLYATSKTLDRAHSATIYGTGLAFDIPRGFAMFIYPRSSCFKNGALQANCVGVIDSGYHGEVHVVMKGLNCEYNVGERIAQAVIMPIPEVEYFEVTNDFAVSERDKGGLGSTGNK